MYSKFLVALLGSAALALAACSKQETPPPAAEAPAANDKAEPTEGTPRIAISPDGIHVQYRVYGSGETALVFIHGWSCDSNYWREQVPTFKQKYTLVMVDLAGHGGTGGNRSEWTIPKYGQDVATAVSAIPNQRLILIGHSMGGPVAIEAARILKDRVIGIIGVDTFKSIGAPVPTQAQIEAIAKPFEANFIGHTRDMVTQHFFAKGADPELVKKVAYDMSLSPPALAIASLRNGLAYDFTGPLKELGNLPILAINSDLGEPLNELRVKKVIPQFRAVTLNGLGHFLMMEDPARFNAALETDVHSIAVPAGS